MSRPPARHQKPSRQSPTSPVLYDERPYDEPRYDEPRYDDRRYDDRRYYPAPYAESPYAESPYRDEAPFGDSRYDEVRYGDSRYVEAPYADRRYNEVRYDDSRYNEAWYDDGSYDEIRFDDRSYDEGRSYDDRSYDEGPNDEGPNDDRRYSQGTADRPRPAGGRGAHRHARPARKRRKPVKIAAAMAGSTLLVAAAAPVAAHWWHRPATHPTALDQENPASTPGAVLGAGPRTPGQPAAPENTLAQWAQIPIGKHAVAQAGAAKRAARHAAAQPSHSPQPQPQATVSAAYQNPLRAVSGLVLERVDMGVDFGGAGPVYALGDGVITNATGDSTGWPGGGWITYQLTDGPDAGLVVYVAEDVKPTVEVGQKVTSSTVIANMFNGGDGIETGWATSDSSTAESQMAAAGGIGGNGPFPTIVGLSFEAVLESVGVPAAPNANEPGNGLLPAGYPAAAS